MRIWQAHRITELEKHAGNLETRVTELTKHAGNLEALTSNLEAELTRYKRTAFYKLYAGLDRLKS